jgi:hypothetical protein
MKLSELERELIATARANPPSDRVPYAFEKRIMAGLAHSPAVDQWALWGRALWRAVAPCAAVMVVLAAWSLLTPRAPSNDLSQALEQTLLAAVDQDQPSDSLW